MSSRLCPVSDKAGQHASLAAVDEHVAVDAAVQSEEPESRQLG